MSIDMQHEQYPLWARLPDGRRVAYLEKGAAKDEARHSLLALHGVGSSRLANMPGISNELLKEFGVRLVSIDRAGYGRSDPALDLTLKSAALDIAALGDILALGEKFWLFGFSGGGGYCWAAARYIPERLAGIALWAPVGNFHWQGITNRERQQMLSRITVQSRRMLHVGGVIPPWLIRLVMRNFVVPTSGTPWLRRCQVGLSPPDRAHLADPEAAHLMVRDNLESLAMGGFGTGMAKDLELFNRPWGFELADVKESFPGPIHLWQGSEDWLVPMAIQRFASQQLPGVVHLHELPGEGHLSWFCFNPDNHRTVLSTLFGPAVRTEAAAEEGGPAGAGGESSERAARGAHNKVTEIPIHEKDWETV